MTNFVRIIGTPLEYGDGNIHIHRKKYSSGRKSPVSDKTKRKVIIGHELLRD